MDQHGSHKASEESIKPHLLVLEAAADLAEAGSADVDCFRLSDGMSDSLVLGLCGRDFLAWGTRSPQTAPI